jgi:hypothetical protein
MSKDLQHARGLHPVRRTPENVHPPASSSGYKSTALRHPKQPLVIIPQTLPELTAPMSPSRFSDRTSSRGCERETVFFDA